MTSIAGYSQCAHRRASGRDLGVVLSLFDFRAGVSVCMCVCMSAVAAFQSAIRDIKPSEASQRDSWPEFVRPISKQGSPLTTEIRGDEPGPLR